MLSDQEVEEARRKERRRCMRVTPPSFFSFFSSFPGSRMKRMRRSRACHLWDHLSAFHLSLHVTEGGMRG